MIFVLKHFKSGNMSYVSHIDLLRHFTRAFRRAGFEIEYSNGFNPHMQINLGTPLPLGINSSCEYLTVRAEESKEDFLERYNRVAPKGLEGIRVFTPWKNPNVAGQTVAADYAVKYHGAMEIRKDLEGLVNLQTLEMPFLKKGEIVKKDVASLINAIKVYPDSLNLSLAAGNTNLRPEKFLAFLTEKFGFTVEMSELWKYEQYVRGANGVLLEMDRYLEELEQEKMSNEEQITERDAPGEEEKNETELQKNN